MPTKTFNQEDFFNYEDTSFGLDFLVKPNEVTLAKDPKNFVLNLDTNIHRLLNTDGLLDSYGLEDLNPINTEKSPRSETIDNALAALYFLINNEEQKAKDIYQYYLLNLPSVFTTGQGQIPDWINLVSGNKGETQALSVAYLLYSVCYYMTATKNTQYRQLALFCAQQLIDLKSSTLNLIRNNYVDIKCSSEPNIIAYLALKLLIPFTNNSDIIDFSYLLKDAIINDLGLRDNTGSAVFSSYSVAMAGLFSLNIGHKFLLGSAKTFLKNYYIEKDNRIIGLGDNGSFDIRATLLAGIFYYRLEQKSLTHSFNTSVIEEFSASQTFKSTDKYSSVQLSLLFLILNKIILNEFIVEELYR